MIGTAQQMLCGISHGGGWHVTHTEQKEYRDLVGKPEGKRELERPGSDRRIIVNYTSKKYDGWV